MSDLIYEIFSDYSNSNSNSNSIPPIGLKEHSLNIEANSMTPLKSEELVPHFGSVGCSAALLRSAHSGVVLPKHSADSVHDRIPPVLPISNSVSKEVSQPGDSQQVDNPHTVQKDSNGKFRFQGKYMFITIAGHYSQDDYIKYIDAQTVCDKGKSRIRYWLIGREVGDSGYKHSHVVIEFKEKICFQRADKLDFEGTHPNIQNIKTTFADAVHYAAKDGDYDSNFDIDDMVPVQKKFDKIINATSKRDVLREARSIQEGQAALNIYKMCKADEMVYEKLDSLNIWQQQAITAFDELDNDRAIFWVADKKGASGKSSLAQHIASDNKNVCIIPDVSTPENIARAIQNHRDNYGEIDQVIIDIARGVGNYVSLYRIMEQCKNNLVLCSKYDSRTIQLNTKGRQHRPRVIIFSNALPKPEDMCHLTYDRWKILQIDNGLLYEVDKESISHGGQLVRCFRKLQ